MKFINIEMKKIIYLIVVGIAVASCSSPTDLEAKKEELKSAKEELSAIKEKIAVLEEEVSKLDTTSGKEEKGASVEVTKLSIESFAHQINVHGVVEASKNIMANPEVAGRITSIKVREGQKISKGQVIATIDASIVRNNIAEVQKGLEFATTIFEKQKALNEKGVGTEVQFLEAKNRKESLEKSLNTLNAQLEKYVVKAPISGYVDDVLPKEGEMANPQMAIARLVNLEKVFVEADISEALLGKVNEGDFASVHFKSLGKMVDGKVVQTGQYIHPQNRTFKIKIDLEEQNTLFKPNLLAVVGLYDYTIDSAVVVPTITIQDDLKGDFVFINEGGKAVKKYVELGMSNVESTEILRGLEGNESIIIKGHKGLVQGEKLNVE